MYILQVNNDKCYWGTYNNCHRAISEKIRRIEKKMHGDYLLARQVLINTKTETSEIIIIRYPNKMYTFVIDYIQD